MQVHSHCCQRRAAAAEYTYMHRGSNSVSKGSHKRSITQFSLTQNHEVKPSAHSHYSRTHYTTALTNVERPEPDLTARRGYRGGRGTRTKGHTTVGGAMRHVRVGGGCRGG